MRALCLFILCAIGVLPVQAFDSWSTFLRPQDATQANFWSVAYGNNTLVVAGEQGSIVTYHYEDAAWVPRESGTKTLWLVGAGFGNGRFIVVGDRGTILTTDDRGETWTPRVSGTTTRLNAVAYGGGRWLVVGEQGVVLTSTDGVTWSSRPSLGTGFLRGLAYGQGQFLIGGAGGVLYATADAQAFTRIVTPNTSDIEAIAISPQRFWIAGSKGLRAVATQLGAWTVGAPATAGTYRGIALRLDEEVSIAGDRESATYVRTPTPEHDWKSPFRAPDFLVTAATRAGNELVAVGFGGNVMRTRMDSPAYLVFEPGTRVAYGTDMRIGFLSGANILSIQWSRNGVDIPGGNQPELVLRNVTPETVQGSYIARVVTTQGPASMHFGGPTVVPGGRPEVRDAGFVSALPVAPTRVAPSVDGRVWVAGGFTVAPGGVTARGLARLNADGSLDPAFRAGLGAFTDSIQGIEPLPNGGAYVHGYFNTIGDLVRRNVARVLADGTVDAGFTADIAPGEAVNGLRMASNGRAYLDLTSAQGARRIIRLTDSGAIDTTFASIQQARLIAIDAGGGVLVHRLNVEGTFTRHRADGGPDPSFRSRNLPGIGGFVDPFASVMPTPGGLFALTENRGKFGVFTSHGKYLPDGEADPGYRSPPSGPYATSWQFAQRYRSDGGVWQTHEAADSFGAATTAYAPSGLPDPTHYATTPDRTFYNTISVAPDGALYALRDPSLSGARGSREFIRIRPLRGAIGRLTNLSVRAYVASADESLIAGFVTAGSESTQAIVRGIGPALRAFDVGDAMTDPRLTLTRDGTAIATTDDWAAALAPRFAATGGFELPAGSKDAALESTVGAGNYTAVVTPAPGDRGTALVELYESPENAPAPRRFVNVSARGPVSPDRPLIAGFSIAGQVPVSVLIRGAGPALSAFGVPDALADPQLKLYRGGTVLWGNDNWSGADAAVASFPFVVGSKDSAMLVTLAPGSYTAVLTGGNAISGQALIEVYERQ